jgi:preprotein translocase subunit YajC
MTFYPFLQAATPPAWMQFAPLIFIFVIVYFFMIRPQNKKQKETAKMISAVTKGDKVITIGGIHGVVVSADEKTIVLKVDDNAKLKFNRAAIATVVADKPAVPEKEAKAKKAVADKAPEKIVDKAAETAQPEAASEEKPSAVEAK